LPESPPKPYFVVKELSGHGVGKAVHEDPSVLNFYEPRDKTKLQDGLVIAIEPMICNRKSDITTKRDGWTIAAKMGSLTAHYEHTVLITDSKPIVLTK
jgi:methionyl aminopeptidase